MSEHKLTHLERQPVYSKHASCYAAGVLFSTNESRPSQASGAAPAGTDD
jgi:hypothetical protein